MTFPKLDLDIAGVAGTPWNVAFQGCHATSTVDGAVCGPPISEALPCVGGQCSMGGFAASVQMNFVDGGDGVAPPPFMPKTRQTASEAEPQTRPVPGRRELSRRDRRKGSSNPAQGVERS